VANGARRLLPKAWNWGWRLLANRNRPVILCYHAVSTHWKTPLAVTPEQLAAQLRSFAARGYVGLTFVEAERRRRSGDLPPRTLVVTFDDAFLSILEARPILAGLGYPATVFVVGAFASGDRPLEWTGIREWLDSEHRDELRCLSEEDLRGLQGEGWEIGSHTMTHPRLTELDSEACLHELVSSREFLAERFGSCETIAYPFGDADDRVAALAERAGYLAGGTLPRSLRRDAPLLRPRVAVSGPDSRFRVWLKMSRPGLWTRRTLPTRVTELL